LDIDELLRALIRVAYVGLIRMSLTHEHPNRGNSEGIEV